MPDLDDIQYESSQAPSSDQMTQLGNELERAEYILRVPELQERSFANITSIFDLGTLRIARVAS